ncbi:MAG: HDIG domain-containing metalloprotein, partial [Planctomycetota bacterium]
RVSGVQLQPNRIVLAMDMLKRADVILRLAMCLGAAILIWLVTTGWAQPFSFREGDVPERAITTRVPFRTPNDKETEQEREKSRQRVITIYTHDNKQIESLRLQLLQEVRLVVKAESLDALNENPTTKDIWARDFMHNIAPMKPGDAVAKTNSDYFAEFKAALENDSKLETYEKAVREALFSIEKDGLLDQLQHSYDKQGGLQDQIRVAIGDDGPATLVSVDDVRIENALPKLRERLAAELLSEPLARHTAAWFSVKGRLKQTLTYNREATEEAAAQAAADTPPVENVYEIGQTLAPGGAPLNAEDIALLKEEYRWASKAITLPQKLSRTVAIFGMYATVFSICGFYGLFRRTKLLTDTQSLFRVLCLSVVTIALCRFASIYSVEGVIIPLLLFSMTIVIAYDQELALLLSTVMSLVVVVSLGLGLSEFTVYVAALSTVVLCLRDVRSRTKLIYVGLVTAAIAAATAIGCATLADPAQGYGILVRAAWYGFFSVMAGMLMTALLPFIENLFDIQTEQSLLELADVAHPLLQELIRRAPGTYNHTINVASIAEAAAEAINANGLLVRVGAYFHDIGKMVKPGYFIENQGDGGNRHESLLPAMSTLVIIAHVKDGADLARQHNLPNVLVDFIMQHHGTTLVEYFYNRANEQSESDPDYGEVDEHSYRYPGPKPQTKEAAVLMLADTVESAGRSLTEPTPSRIESLVHDLSMKKLLDGQFDECGLTLSELKKIEVSLIKSLSAVYHARIKYPDQQSA